jgi:hypothetical protein
MSDKPINHFKTPDLSKLKEVVIDERTKIYVPIDADPDEAKSRFLSRLGEKNKAHIASRKPEK